MCQWIFKCRLWRKSSVPRGNDGVSDLLNAVAFNRRQELNYSMFPAFLSANTDGLSLLNERCFLHIHLLFSFCISFDEEREKEKKRKEKKRDLGHESDSAVVPDCFSVELKLKSIKRLVDLSRSDRTKTITRERIEEQRQDRCLREKTRRNMGPVVIDDLVISGERRISP